MKNYFLALLCLVSISCFGQLNLQTPEQVHGYKTVYECEMQYGEIRYINGIYVFCGSTDNRYEDTMATIVLGKTKESAIKTLRDLQKLKNTITYKDVFYVNGFNNARTKLFKSQSTLAFSTEYVAGTSYALWKTDFEYAVLKIQNFTE